MLIPVLVLTTGRHEYQAHQEPQPFRIQPRLGIVWADGVARPSTVAQRQPLRKVADTWG